MSETSSKPWMPLVSLSLKVGLALAVAYAAYDYFTRPGASGGQPKKEKETPLQADLYVHPSKTHITRYASAQKLVGMDLWAKEGWRWPVEPGARLLGPLEHVKPTRVFEQDGELRIAFEKDGQASWMAVGSGGRVFVDDIFFTEKPEELYKHWPEQDWQRVRSHETWMGMSEMQAIFSLGYGRPLDASPGGQTRIVEFPGPPGGKPVVITFRNWLATEIR
jgi:hypothetical protein